MKVNKNSPRRPLRPLSAIIDFPTPAGRRWGKHFRDGKKSSECWERENNPKKLCVCLCLFGALPSLRWKRFRCNERWMMMTTRAVERDSGGLAQTHTRRNIHQYCGFWLARRLVSHVEWWRGGGKFQYRPTRETASRNRHGVLTVPSTCRVVYYWHDDRGTWARVGKQSKRIAMATP